MGFAKTIGKYQLGRTIGEGTFAKVKLGVDSTSGHYVAIKVIDKQMVMASDLKYQVKREIQTMKLLDHPNIARIHEVIGSKKNIYIVMEYISGGQLSDKLVYSQKLKESEARKLFQQLIDAVDYCHNKGVYHRDLKPAGMLSTTCGSPCYVAPELLANKGYDGATADVWSCGVILFELLAGYLPFEDRNLVVLYRKRVTIPEIIQDAWFQTDYVPSCGIELDDKICNDDVDVDVDAAFDAVGENDSQTKIPKSSSFINAFKLISMSQDLDLSRLFEEQEQKQTTRLGSKHTVDETLSKIETAAADVSLSFERRKSYKITMQPKQKTRSSGTYYDLSAEVIEVAPTSCVVEITKASGDHSVYRQFADTQIRCIITHSRSRRSKQLKQKCSRNGKVSRMTPTA
ncbi:hypothetical protein Tsubulata_012087 [Turnera subulata]|uniref:non-specific serine/threonine protein kinase n=1 Tax=Turnera subulata TaxID=218843 RepID=A0A9Q0IZ81_9ROSI|nr:hypothetical protein Tsubulata_012087 [Turnera subulata]